jgi:hypothetical protein
MEVVNLPHPRSFEDVTLNLGHGDALGRGLEEHVDTVAEQAGGRVHR